MATIGTITVAFATDLKALSRGIEEASSLFDTLKKDVDDLTTSLAALSGKTVEIKASVDTSEVLKAKGEIEDLQTTIKSTSASASASADVKGLAEAIEEVEAPAVRTRSALASIIVTTAQVTSVVLAARKSYKDFRETFALFVAASTGTKTATQAISVVQSALRGDTESLVRILRAGETALRNYAGGFFSAKTAVVAAETAIGVIAPLLGVTDQATVQSIQILARLATQQIASAATSTLRTKSLDALSQAYSRAADKLIPFVKTNETAVAVSKTLSSVIDSVAPAVVRANSAFNRASRAIAGVTANSSFMSAVSSATGKAFDTIASKISGLIPKATSLSSSMVLTSANIVGVVPATSRLAPSFTALTTSATGLASAAGRLFNVFNVLSSAVGIVKAATASNQTAAGFAGMVAQMAATSVATGAAIGAMTSLAAGTSALAGASAGAAGAVAGLVTTFPVFAALAATAAVATGQFHDRLKSLASAAETVEQLSERFGATTQEMERLKMAAEFSGTSMMMLARAQQSFFSSLAKIKIGQLDSQNVREAKIAFDKLNVSLEDLKQKDPREIFAEVGKKINEVKDPAERTAIAMDLLGMRGAMILPALKEFSELASDFDRLGGALNDIDFKRFSTLEQSFDRADAATKSFGRTLLVPFTELQRAFNNLSAEVSGGLSKALAPIASMIADITKPVAAVIEAFARMVNVALRLVGVVAQAAAWLQVFATVGTIFDGFSEGFRAAMKPLEDLISLLTGGTSKASSFGKIAEYTTAALKGLGSAIGMIVGAIANLVIALGVGIATWGLYAAATTLAGTVSLVAAANFAIAWAAALGPITIVVGVLAALGAAVIGVATAIMSGVKSAYAFGQSIGLIGKDRKLIDATKASVDELAAAAEESAKIRNSSPEGLEQYRTAIQESRDSLSELTIQASQFGDAGADVASTATTEFNKLQESLNKGDITLKEFRQSAALVNENLRENLDAMKNDAPEATLKKNLELYRSLDSAAKSASKSVRDIAAGTVIDDKIFPASEEIKSRAAEYKNEYVKALEEIKKKQQSGGFDLEIKQKKDKNVADLNAGRISMEQYEKVKLELDSTNAQEQASIAAEEIKREFDRKNKIDIELDMSFADGIRKSLDDAFLSPVQKFEKELEKINSNKSLTDSEKIMARADLRKRTTEGLVGKSAESQFQERRRDLNQAADAGLIGRDKLKAELEKASEDFAKAIGVTQTPFEAFASSTKNIASQFGMAGQPLDQVREKLKGNAEQLGLFDRAVKESRDNLLASLGIEKTPQAVFEEQMKKIDEALANKSITGDQAAEAREAATRKKDEALGAGSNLAGQFADRQRKIDEAFGGDGGEVKKGIAENKLAMDRRAAAGLDATPAQALKAGVDKVNDAFGVTGKSMEEIKASLSPKDFEEYQEALKKNSDAVKANLGVERTGADKIAESRTKLAKAVADGVISDEERNKAIKQQRDGLLSSLGIKKTPSQDFEDAVQKIKENASELNPDEIAKGLKEAKDSLLSSLGIDKSPADQTEDAMKKLREAFGKGQISAEEFAKGSQKARDSLLQSLGIPLDPVKQLRQRMNDLNEAMSKGQLTDEEFRRGQEEARRSMLPGGEEESPVKKFQRDLKAINDAASEGLIDPNDAALRKANLQAQLQEDLKPSLDKVAPDRRGVEGADTRSKAGVDTFFRILRGNDNPSLKAQLEIARNTKVLAEASKDPDAAPVIAQLAIR